MERVVSVCGLAFDWEVPEAWVRRSLERAWGERAITAVLPLSDDEHFSLDAQSESIARALAEEHGNPGTGGRVTHHRFGPDE